MPTIGMWSDEIVWEVRQLFGDKSRMYGLALTQSTDLVDEVRQAARRDGYKPEELLEKLAFSDGRVNPGNAQRFVTELAGQVKMAELLRKLEANEAYQRTMAYRRHQAEQAAE